MNDNNSFGNQGKNYNNVYNVLLYIIIIVLIIFLLYPLWIYLWKSSKLIEKKIIAIEKIENIERNISELEKSSNHININSRLTILENKIESVIHFVHNDQSIINVLEDIDKVKKDINIINEYLYCENDNEKIAYLRKVFQDLKSIKENNDALKKELKEYYISWKEGLVLAVFTMLIDTLIIIIPRFVDKSTKTERINQ